MNQKVLGYCPASIDVWWGTFRRDLLPCSAEQSSEVLSSPLSLFCHSTRRYIPVASHRDARPVTSSNERSIRIWEISVRISVGYRLAWLWFIVVFLSPYSSRCSADPCDAGRCCPYVAVGTTSGMAVGRQLRNVTVRVLALMQGLVGKIEGKRQPGRVGG